MAQQILVHNARSDDPLKMYASPTGARYLQKANKIFEDFPFSKYLLYFIIFTVEVSIVIWLGLHLVH